MRNIFSFFIFTLLFLQQTNAQECYSSEDYFEQMACCDDCQICCPSYWIEAEYLLWTMKESPKIVPLVTTGPIVPNLSPVLDTPGTSIVLGDHRIKGKSRSGAKFTIGSWLMPEPQFGIEFSYLFLAKKTDHHSVSSSGLLGSPFLAIPFFNVVTDTESSTRLALPGSFAGDPKLKVSNDMQGAEVNSLLNVCSDCCWSVNVITGFRYWNFNESMTFTTDSPSINPPADVFQTKDKFKVENQFYGGQIGLEALYCWNCFYIKGKGKIACGVVDEKLKISGELLTNDFNGFATPELFPAGYFGLPTNNGSYRKNHFAYLPEIDLAIGYNITNCLSIEVGYNLLYLSHLMRATNQIDREINPSQVPGITGDPSTEVIGERSPRALKKTTSFWAQGVTVGLNYFF